MITINPIKLNTPKTITFGEGNLNNLKKKDGILLLQGPAALQSFEKNNELTYKADVVQQNNPIKIAKAVVNKFRKAYNITATPEKINNTSQYQVSFMA